MSTNYTVDRLRLDNKALREALDAIVAEADQSNGGKGAKLPIVIYMRQLAVDAIRKAKGEL